MPMRHKAPTLFIQFLLLHQGAGSIAFHVENANDVHIPGANMYVKSISRGNLSGDAWSH